MTIQRPEPKDEISVSIPLNRATCSLFESLSEENGKTFSELLSSYIVCDRNNGMISQETLKELTEEQSASSEPIIAENPESIVRGYVIRLKNEREEKERIEADKEAEKEAEKQRLEDEKRLQEQKEREEENECEEDQEDCDGSGECEAKEESTKKANSNRNTKKAKNRGKA